MRVRLYFIILLFILFLIGTVQAQTILADPKPSPDNPRKIAIALNTDDPKIANRLLFNVINIQKFYGIDNVRLAVVAYGPGVKILMKKTSSIPKRVSSQQHYGITFIACGNTMDAMGKKKDSLIDGVKWVQAGLPELVEKQLNGWVVINPY